MKEFAIKGHEAAERGAAQSQRFLQNRVEHRHQLTRRGIDDPNTSAVAVCCSSASRVSLMRRAFSIAITACAAKFSIKAICRSENSRTSCRKTEITPSTA